MGQGWHLHYTTERGHLDTVRLCDFCSDEHGDFEEKLKVAHSIPWLLVQNFYLAASELLSELKELKTL